MRPPLHPPTRIAIGMHPSLIGSDRTAQEVSAALGAFNLETVICDSLYSDKLKNCIEKSELDILIALGGDGTMLRAGRICAPHQLPVLGINLGHFGFLMELDGKNWREALPRLAQAQYMIEDRMMIHGEHWRGESLQAEWEALNDVVISRGSQVRPIQLIAEVDGYSITNYVADGLIVATPTGSTAYALAVQGPVLSPELRNILIAPVAPHLSVDKTIIVADSSKIRVVVRTRHEAVLSPDGRGPMHLVDGDVIKVQSSKHIASFVRLYDPGYFYHNLTRYLEHNPTAASF
ncbi:MAG: NAD(+)/NADH kinase [Anaerolineae bacterium]|nr:NAD(+)/NADH kinase [Anaerolineae bacterium]